MEIWHMMNIHDYVAYAIKVMSHRTNSGKHETG